MARAPFAGEGLLIDFALQRHEGVHQRFGRGGQPGM
jgi:hypothetical protein